MQTVVEEGELESWRPRFGATGDVRLELLTISGLPQDQATARILRYTYVNNIVQKY